MSRAGVADVQLLVIGREAEAVGLVEFVGHFVDLAGLASMRYTASLIPAWPCAFVATRIP